MSWGEFLWSWRGRLNRLQFALGFHGLGLATILLSYVLLAWVASEDAVSGGYRATERVNLVLTLSPLPALPFQASMLVRRVHDLNRSGWMVFAWFAVSWLVVGAYLVLPDHRVFIEWVAQLVALVILWMAFAPGDPAANDYGPAPAAGWWP